MASELKSLLNHLEKSGFLKCGSTLGDPIQGRSLVALAYSTGIMGKLARYKLKKKGCSSANTYNVHNVHKTAGFGIFDRTPLAGTFRRVNSFFSTPPVRPTPPEYENSKEPVAYGVPNNGPVGNAVGKVVDTGKQALNIPLSPHPIPSDTPGSDGSSFSSGPLDLLPSNGVTNMLRIAPTLGWMGMQQWAEQVPERSSELFTNSFGFTPGQAWGTIQQTPHELYLAWNHDPDSKIEQWADGMDAAFEADPWGTTKAVGYALLPHSSEELMASAVIPGPFARLGNIPKIVNVVGRGGRVTRTGLLALEREVNNYNRLIAVGRLPGYQPIRMPAFQEGTTLTPQQLRQLQGIQSRLDRAGNTLNSAAQATAQAEAGAARAGGAPPETGAARAGGAQAEAGAARVGGAQAETGAARAGGAQPEAGAARVGGAQAETGAAVQGGAQAEAQTLGGLEARNWSPQELARLTPAELGAEAQALGERFMQPGYVPTQSDLTVLNTIKGDKAAWARFRSVAGSGGRRLVPSIFSPLRGQGYRGVSSLPKLEDAVYWNRFGREHPWLMNLGNRGAQAVEWGAVTSPWWSKYLGEPVVPSQYDRLPGYDEDNSPLPGGDFGTQDVIELPSDAIY